MATLRERVPKPLRTPLSFVSIALAIIGVAIGYIFTMMGIILYFDLHLASEISDMEALGVLAFGLAFVALAYAGFKGFMYFAY